MAAYCRVYGFGHLRADCREPGSAPEPYARSGYMTTFSLYIGKYCVAQWRTDTASGLGYVESGVAEDVADQDLSWRCQSPVHCLRHADVSVTWLASDDHWSAVVSRPAHSTGHTSAPRRQVSLFIHAEHVVHSAWILFWLWMYACLYVCMYVSALERKRLIGMTWNSEP